MTLPQTIKRVIVPPIKCQGIKTKLVPFILANIQWQGEGRWVEPFLGSGVVLFNLAPKQAKINDTNPHLINFYRQLYDGSLTEEMIRSYLLYEGERLLQIGEAHYYFIRERFNQTLDVLDFLFLNRSCFNGLMRFNKQGKFNVPFCRKPNRFRQAYITKIVNQVAGIRRIMADKEWVFTVGDWQKTFEGVRSQDFIYLDPPYIGRHTSYYNQWNEQDAVNLATLTHNLPCGVALSMWKQNKYRSNQHLQKHWKWATERTYEHFYHVGSNEKLRHAMQEVLMIKPGFESPIFAL